MNFNSPTIRKDIEITQIVLSPNDFICVFANGIQIEILHSDDGRVGVFFDEHVDVLGFPEQHEWTGSNKCPNCGDDRTGKGSLIASGKAYCNGRCYEEAQP